MAYEPINWQDLPSEETPIDADNLNHMDEQIKANADAMDGVEESVNKIYEKGYASKNLMPISKLERNNEGFMVENYPIYLPEGTYTLSADVERGNGGWAWIFSKNGVDVATFDGGYDNEHYYQTRVLNSDVDSLRVYTNAKGKAYNIMLNEGIEALPYQAYAKSNVELTECINTISDAYNSSKTYAQGEFCIYNNTLWKSKVNNNAGNIPIEGSYWTVTNIGNLLNCLYAPKVIEGWSCSDAIVNVGDTNVIQIGNMVVITLNYVLASNISQGTPLIYNLPRAIRTAVANCIFSGSPNERERGVTSVKIVGNENILFSDIANINGDWVVGTLIYFTN